MFNGNVLTTRAYMNVISPALSIDITNRVLNSSVAIGEQIDFIFEFDDPGGNWMFQCNGEIVQIENRDGRVGLAVKVHDSVMGSA